MTRMTRAEFIAAYCERSKVDPAWLMSDEGGKRIALPCDCDSETCEGWAMVRNERSAIDAHSDFCAPKPHGNG